MTLFWVMILFLTLLALSFILIPLFSDNTVAPFSQKIRLTILLIIVFPLLALFLYLKWGGSEQLKQYYASQKERIIAEQLRAQMGTPQQVIQQLQLHLAKYPHSAKGWYLLGRLYASQAQYIAATKAFAKANNLQPHQPDILIQYAEALALENNAQFNQQADALLHEVLTIAPGDDEARNLVAISAYQHHDYQNAIKNWQIILPHFPVNSLEYKSINDAIVKAKQALIMPSYDKNKIS